MSPLHRRWQSPVTRMKLVAGLLLLWPIDVRRGREAALRGQG